jgi:membrane protein
MSSPEGPSAPLYAGGMGGRLAVRRTIQLFKQAVSEWTKDSASSRAAALSYYSALSISPLLIIAIFIAGLVFGPDEVRGRVMIEVQKLVGAGGAEVIGSMLAAAHTTSGGLLATIIGIVTLLFGAAGVFVELQDALNAFWGVQSAEGSGIWSFFRNRLLSFAMVLGIGFLMLVSLLLSTALAALSAFVSNLVPALHVVAHVANIVFSMGVITVLFALIYKVLPDVDLHWRDVWTGAAATAVLFTVGKFLIGFYLGRASTASPYGAAGSVIVILLWVYYSALIVYFGAEFTKVYARQHGSHQRRFGASEVAGNSGRLEPSSASSHASQPGRRPDPRRPAPGASA